MIKIALIIFFVVLYFVFLDKHILKITSSWYSSHRDLETHLHIERDRQKVKEIISVMGKGDTGVTANELETIVGIGEVAIEPLTEALYHKEPKVRWIAAKALGEIGGPQVIGPLVQAAKDKSDWVRLTVAGILVKLFKPDELRISDALIELLHDDDSYVRDTVMQTFAIGAIKDTRAVDTLIGLLKDKNVNMRKDAATALGKTRDYRAVEPLITLLRDPDWVVQQHAILALKEIADPKAIEPLLSMLKHEVPALRVEAARALAAMGDKRAAEVLEKAAAEDYNKEISEPLHEAFYVLKTRLAMEGKA